jgi:hypothetical protein
MSEQKKSKIQFGKDSRYYTRGVTSELVVSDYLKEKRLDPATLATTERKMAARDILKRMIGYGMAENLRTEESIYMYLKRGPNLFGTRENTPMGKAVEVIQRETYSPGYYSKVQDVKPKLQASNAKVLVSQPNLDRSSTSGTTGTNLQEHEDDSIKGKKQKEVTGSVDEPQSADKVYKVVRFGKVTDEESSFLDQLNLPVMDGFRLLNEEPSNKLFGFNWTSFQNALRGSPQMHGKCWEDLGLPLLYDNAKRQLELALGSKLEHMPFSNLLHTFGMEDYNFEFPPEDGKWYYKAYSSSVCLIIPFQEFDTVEMEENSIKSIEVSFQGCQQVIEAEENTPLENIWDEFRSVVGSSWDLPIVPTRFSFAIDGSEDAAQEYDPEVEIGTHSAVRFYYSEETVFELTSRYTEVEPIDVPTIYKKQRNVGQKIFERFQEIVGDWSQFKKVRYCVATAGYSSLREQTKARMEEFGLLSEDVWICNAKSGLHPALEFHKEVTRPENKDTLFVMICDESHWGINKGGVYERMMNGVNDNDLKDAKNFIQLFVSATPYNLLTKDSRVPSPDNVIIWEEVKDFPINSAAPPGLLYVGLTDFLKKSYTEGWENVSPIRSDDDFENCLNECGLKPVEGLAGEYLLSIMKAFVHGESNIARRWDLWKQEVSKFSIADKRVFDAVLNYYRKRKHLEDYVKNFVWPETETDRIINDLINSNTCMKVVRIAPGEDKDSGAASDRIAKKKFLDPIRTLLNRLKFDKFILLGDFGKQKPQKMLTRPLYRQYWADMQNNCCDRCPCTNFESNNKNEKCNNCKHVHKNFKSYSDLGGLPILLVIVMKGRLGDTFPASFSTLDMRVTKRIANNVNLSSLVQELGRLCFHSKKSPDEWNRIALVSKSLLEKLMESVDLKKECISYKNMKLPVDCFVDGGKGDVSLEELRKKIPSQRSMDYKNESKWSQRVLLWAEPQNGKTGAFIWFLRLLLQHVEKASFPNLVGDEEVVMPQPDFEAPPMVEFFPKWFFPLEPRTMGKIRPYNNLLTGKYHKNIAIRRLLWSKNESISEFKECVIQYEGPFSENAAIILKELNRVNVNWDGFLDREGNVDIRAFCDYDRVSKEPSSFIAVDKLSNEPIALTSNEFPDKASYSPIVFKITENYIRIPASTLEASIPKEKQRFFKNNRFQTDLRSCHVVLTPSYQSKVWWVEELTKPSDANRESDPSKCRLNYSLFHTTGKPIIHVLLVRPSQFEAYLKIWGNTHIIIKLPEKLEYVKKDKLHFVNKEYFVNEGGVGFARLVGQVWAHQMGIDHCFMFDDNVISCFELQLIANSAEFTQRIVPFSRVMEQLEAVFLKDTSMLGFEGRK